MKSSEGRHGGNQGRTDRYEAEQAKRNAGLNTDVDSLTAARLTSTGSVLMFVGAGDDQLTVTDVNANFLLAVGGIGDDTMSFANLDVNNATLLGYLGEDRASLFRSSLDQRRAGDLEFG